MATTGGLTDAGIRKAKAGERPYNLYDSGGLYLTVAPTGARWWRLKYRYANRERRIGLGGRVQLSIATPGESKRSRRPSLCSYTAKWSCPWPMAA